MKFLKKHISAIVALVVFVLVVVGLLYFKQVFNADEATAIYGSRLEGIEKVEIKVEDSFEKFRKPLEEKIEIKENKINLSLNDFVKEFQ